MLISLNFDPLGSRDRCEPMVRRTVRRWRSTFIAKSPFFHTRIKRTLTIALLLSGFASFDTIWAQERPQRPPPRLFPDNVLTREQIEDRNSVFQPRPALSASVRYEESKKLYEFARRQGIERAIEQLEAVRKPTSAIRRLLESLHADDVPVATKVSPPAVRDVLDRLSPSQFGMRRVRMAYSDLIRELRADGDEASITTLAADVREFRAKYEPGQDYEFETWRELALYDLAIARDWVVKEEITEPILAIMLKEDAEQWLTVRICEGLNLPADAPSAALWKQLKAYDSLTMRIQIQLRPLLEEQNALRKEGLFSLFAGILDSYELAELRGDESDPNNAVRPKDQRAIDEIEDRIEARDNQKLDRVRDLETIDANVGELEAQLLKAQLPLRCLNTTYARERANQLSIPRDDSRIKLSLNAGSLVLTNQSTDSISDATAFVLVGEDSAVFEIVRELTSVPGEGTIELAKGRSIEGYAMTVVLVAPDFWCVAEAQPGNAKH